MVSAFVGIRYTRKSQPKQSPQIKLLNPLVTPILAVRPSGPNTPKKENDHY